MITPVVAKIMAMQPSLTVIENEIAKYVIENPSEVSTSTITTIAKKTNTSDASVNRFCKKIGYKGFNRFKIALAQDSFYNNTDENDVSGEGHIASVYYDYKKMLVNTSAMLDEDVLIKSVKAIKQAQNIYIFAFLTTALAAEELAFNLNTIGFNVKVAADINTIKVLASHITSNDIAILIVPTILMKDIHQTVTACKDAGAKILSITSYDSPKLDELVDYKFVTSDKITSKNVLTLSNNLIFLYVIDIIFTALLDDDKVLRQRKMNSDALISTHPIVSSHILEY